MRDRTRRYKAGVYALMRTSTRDPEGRPSVHDAHQRQGDRCRRIAQPFSLTSAAGVKMSQPSPHSRSAAAKESAACAARS